ncbi:MAG TPA: hypothetical protein VGQ83_03220, partial [Polyangia bacterium]
MRVWWAAAVVLAACGRGPQPPGEADGAGAAAGAASAAYRVIAPAPGQAAFRAANPAQGFTTALATAGPIIEPAAAAAPRWALALTLSSLGCPGAAVPAGARAAA